MNNRLKLYQQEDGVLYNLEMTPAEESCYRLAQLDKAKYKDIFTQGTNEIPYYSSLLIPSSENIWWLYKAQTEAQILPEFGGGTIHRLHLGKEDDVNHLTHITKQLSGMTIPYFDYTPTISYCPNCGNREVGVYPKCRKCSHQNDIFSRVCGYYRPVRKWNEGKQQEFSDRSYVAF